MSKKIDRAQRAARQQKVAQFMASATPMPEIISKISQEFGCGQRTVRNDAIKIEEELLFDLRRDMAKTKARQIHRLELTARAALMNKDFGANVAALREINRMIGLHAPEKVEHDHRGDLALKIDSMTTGERRARIDELLRKAGWSKNGGSAEPLLSGVDHRDIKPLNGSNGTNGSGGH